MSITKHLISHRSDYAVIWVIDQFDEPIDVKIDAQYIDLVKGQKWFIHNGYVACLLLGDKKFTYLHNFIFGKPDKGYLMHHVNHDRADNRRENIQIVTHSENNMLKPAQKNRSTERQGISKCRGGYSVLVGPKGKRKFFRTWDQALKAREDYETLVQERILERTVRFFGELEPMAANNK